ncbi:MAG: hypothetical protein R3Y59_05615 [bacterium]
MKDSEEDMTLSEVIENLGKLEKLADASLKDLKKVMPDPFVEKEIETEVLDGLHYEVTNASIVSGKITSGTHVGQLNYKISISLTTTDEILLPHTVESLWTKYKGRDVRYCAYVYICYKFVDSKGDIIDQGQMLVAGDNRFKNVGTRYSPKRERIDPINLPTGEQVDIEVDYRFGDFNERDIAMNIKKADLDKIVFITEEEFNNNQEILYQRNAAR